MSQRRVGLTGIAPNLFYRWKDAAEQGAKAALGGRSAAAAETEKDHRIRQLERTLGQKGTAKLSSVAEDNRHKRWSVRMTEFSIRLRVACAFTLRIAGLDTLEILGVEPVPLDGGLVTSVYRQRVFSTKGQNSGREDLRRQREDLPHVKSPLFHIYNLVAAVCQDGMDFGFLLGIMKFAKHRGTALTENAPHSHQTWTGMALHIHFHEGRGAMVVKINEIVQADGSDSCQLFFFARRCPLGDDVALAARTSQDGRTLMARCGSIDRGDEPLQLVECKVAPKTVQIDSQGLESVSVSTRFAKRGKQQRPVTDMGADIVDDVASFHVLSHQSLQWVLEP